MLSRTAEYLYWISRYMERAETNARLLDVGYRMSLFPNPNGYNNEWESVLAAAGAIEGYKNKYNIIEQKKVEDYLFFDEDNPSSVYNCILNARNNALVVRTSFTPESWLAVNKTYQEILKLKNNNFNASDLPNLTEWTIEQVNLFRGSLSSLLRNDGYNFLYLGLFVERADNSARLLDVKYFVLLPKPQYIGGNIDNMQWSILLRSLSSFRAFRWPLLRINFRALLSYQLLALSLFQRPEQQWLERLRLKKLYRLRTNGLQREPFCYKHLLVQGRTQLSL